MEKEQTQQAAGHLNSHGSCAITSVSRTLDGTHGAAKQSCWEQLLNHHHITRGYWARQSHPSTGKQKGEDAAGMGQAGFCFAPFAWRARKSLPQWVKRVFQSCSPPISNPEFFWEALPSTSSFQQQGKLVVIPTLVLTPMTNKTLKETGWYGIKLYTPSLKHS